MHVPGDAPSDVRWHPFTALDGRLLADHVAALGDRLGAGEHRPIASILHLGAASAICAPLLASAAANRVVPPLQPEHVQFGFRASGPLQLALIALPEGRPALLPELADQLIDVAVRGLLEPFTRALTTTVALPQKTLQGNLFSALAAAARLVEPEQAGARARALVDLVVRRFPALRAAGTFDWRGVHAGDRHAYFRRRNCCLFYRVPGGGICGDCILSA
jgi:ferric iron reductase protein FhuF